MKFFLRFFLIQLLVGPSAWGIDEKDIPPPPMPEYMKNKGYESASPSRSTASEQPVEDEVPYEDVKREFLEAGDDEVGTEEITAVDEVQTGDIEEGGAEPMVQNPTMVLEDPVDRDNNVDPVNAVEESVPEFEQAEINDPKTDGIRKKYLQSGQEELQDEVHEYQPDENQSAEELASVEQKMEQSEEEDREVSSSKSFKPGMYKFRKECTMYKEDSSFSDKAGVIRAGRKLWIDPHSSNWHKAYKKSGEVYISADCLTK